MRQRGPSIFRESLGLIGMRPVLQQAGLAAAVALLCVLWLHLPDASVMDVIGSFLLGLVIVWIAGAGETALFLRLCGMPRERERLLRGAVLLIAGAALWIWACSWVVHLERSNWQLAGFFNSKVSFRWRSLLSFAHLVLWLGWIGTAVKWVIAGGIAGIGSSAVADKRAIWPVLRSITYWLVLVIAAAIGSTVTGLLVSWTPGHGLPTELASLVLRLGLALLVDCSLAVWVLAVAAATVRRAQANYETPGGVPLVSQPRTVDNP